MPFAGWLTGKRMDRVIEEIRVERYVIEKMPPDMRARAMGRV